MKRNILIAMTISLLTCMCFVCRAQVRPLPILPPDSLVQSYTGRLAHTLLNDFVKKSDSVYRNGKLCFSKNPYFDYIGINPQEADTLTISSFYHIKLFSWFGYTFLSRSPTLSDSSNRVATTKFVKRNLENFISNDDERLTDARTPTGYAGGDLTGPYPNPTISTQFPRLIASVDVNGFSYSFQRLYSTSVNVRLVMEDGIPALEFTYKNGRPVVNMFVRTILKEDRPLNIVVRYKDDYTILCKPMLPNGEYSSASYRVFFFDFSSNI